MSTTYDGINIVAAVQAWWTAQPAMQALTSDGNLWHRTAPEDTALPYATVFLVSEPTEVWTTALSLQAIHDPDQPPRRYRHRRADDRPGRA